MQSRAQRRQYGEPVEWLSLSVRYGQRHTRGLEAELVSVTRSALQIRSPRVHVPPRPSRVAPGCPKWNSQPITRCSGRHLRAAAEREIVSQTSLSEHRMAELLTVLRSWSGRATFESIALRAPTASFFVFQGNNDSQTPVQHVRELEAWNRQLGHLNLTFRYYEGAHVGGPPEVNRELPTC
jgi:hypothetical protein